MAIDPDIARKALRRIETMSDEEFSAKLDAAIPSWANSPDKKKNSRHVVPKDGKWAVKLPSSVRVSSYHPTRGEAKRRATEIVAKLGGGEIVILGRDGRVLANKIVATRIKRR